MYRLALILSCLIAVAPVFAADEPAQKAKGSSSLERSIDKTGKAMGKTADKAEKGAKRGLTATEKGINSAGQKTGDWLNRQADRVK